MPGRGLAWSQDHRDILVTGPQGHSGHSFTRCILPVTLPGLERAFIQCLTYGRVSPVRTLILSWPLSVTEGAESPGVGEAWENVCALSQHPSPVRAQSAPLPHSSREPGRRLRLQSEVPACRQCCSEQLALTSLTSDLNSHRE